MGMAKCKECTHYLTCRQGNSNPDYCGLFMNYENTVEVVRCKDCKHWGGVIYGGRCKQWSAPLAGVTHFTSADDFCSYGERKDNERKAD